MIPFGWFQSDLIRLFEPPSPPRGRQENGLPRRSACNDISYPRPHFAFCILYISVLQEALIRLALAGDARATFPSQGKAGKRIATPVTSVTGSQ